MADLSSLVLRLSADIASFQSDLGKAVAISKASADQISGAFTKSIQGAGQVVKDFAGTLVAAFAVDKLVEVGRAAIDLGDDINKMSQKVGISVENLSALRVAAKLSDVSFDDLGTAAGKLSKNMAEAAGGGKQQAAAFQAIGVSVKDANGNLRGTNDVLQDVAKKFSTYGDSAAKTALAQQIFGKSGAELIPLLNQLGDQGFGAVTQAAKDYNQVIGKEQAQQSEDFNDNLTRLTLAASGFANAIVSQMLPGLLKYSGAMAEASKTTEGYASSASVFANAAKGIVLALDFIKTAIEGLTNFILALGDTLGAAGDLFNGFGKAVISDLTAVGEAMRGNFSAAKEAMNSAGESLSAGWERASTRVKAAWMAAGSGISDGQQHIKESFEQLFGTFSNVSAGADTTAKKMRDLPAPLVAAADASNDASKAADAYAASLVKAAEMLAKFQGGISPSEKALQDYVKAQIQVSAQADDMVVKGTAAGKALEAFAAAQAFAAQASEANAAVLAKQNAALAKQGDVLGNYLEEIGKSNALIGLSDKEKAIQIAIQKVTDEYNKNTAAGIKNAQSLGQVAAGAGAAAAAAFDLEKKAADVSDFVKQFGQVSELEKFTKGLEDVGDALNKAIGEGAVDKIKELQKTLGGIRQAMVDSFVHSSQDGLRSLQSLTTEGSKAFQAMQIAIDALTVVQAISAVLNQGMGDPYTAFARMAAMATAVVALGVDIGNFGGGSGSSQQSSEARQSSQGTGSVLGDAEAKSESIAKATEITANATQQLVGLNRGMLTALQALQNALGAAGNQLARGAGNVAFAGASSGFNIGDPFGQDPLGGAIGSFLFGGDSEVIDQGIVIAGGTLQEMLNNIVVGAYQTIETDGGLFGSDDVSDQIVDISSEFGKQFQLVIQSISDTVREGALALGLLPADVEAAMAQFRVEEQRISLEGLSADDQQKALEAVFSKLFDGLAGAVVPFIGQFQKVGEGLGETLVRVATEVQVTQEAIKQLGLAVSETDPEKFAQISDALIAAAGGLDDFISGMQSFVANFSTGVHQLDVSSAAFNSAFSQVGLSVPATRDGMWELMQSLDATTEAGQAQIATLLRLSDTASAYYNQLDDFSSTLGLNETSDFIREFTSIRDAAIGLVTALTRAGASTETLQRVYAAAADKIKEVIAQLQATANSQAANLGYALPTSLDDINAEINALGGNAETATSSVNRFSDAMTRSSQAAMDAINMLLGDLSPLNDQQKLQQALAGQVAGLVTPEAVLQIARRLQGTGSDYAATFAQVMAVGDRTQRGNAGGVGGGGSDTGSHLTKEESDRLAQLLELRDQVTAAQRHTQAEELAHSIADLVSATGESIDEALQNTGISTTEDLQKFMDDLGIANREDFDKLITSLEERNSQGETGADISDDIRTGNGILEDIRDILAGHGNFVRNGSMDVDTRTPPIQERGHGRRSAPLFETP